jgi:hypothetical protein
MVMVGFLYLDREVVHRSDSQLVNQSGRGVAYAPHRFLLVKDLMVKSGQLHPMWRLNISGLCLVGMFLDGYSA